MIHEPGRTVRVMAAMIAMAVTPSKLKRYEPQRLMTTQILRL